MCIMLQVLLPVALNAVGERTGNDVHHIKKNHWFLRNIDFRIQLQIANNIRGV